MEDWIILATIIGCFVFLMVWYSASYRPWYKRLWRNYTPPPKPERGEGVQPDPFPGPDSERLSGWAYPTEDDDDDGTGGILPVAPPPKDPDNPTDSDGRISGDW